MWRSEYFLGTQLHRTFRPLVKGKQRYRASENKDYLIHLRLLHYLNSYELQRDAHLYRFLIPFGKMVHMSLTKDRASYTREEFKAKKPEIWQKFKAGDFEELDNFGKELIQSFKVDGFVCSNNTILYNEIGKKIYSTCDKPCFMYHWTDMEKPELEKGNNNDKKMYCLHSNPFWDWDAGNLHIIEIPKGTRIVAMDKYSEFKKSKQETRREFLVKEIEDEDERKNVLRVFDSFNENNTHREFRLPEETIFKKIAGPVLSSYHTGDGPKWVYRWKVHSYKNAAEQGS